MLAIIVSRLDPAGMNIAKQLLKKGFEETSEKFDNSAVYENRAKKMRLYFINKDQVFADYVDKINCEAFVFASKHSSESKRPCLTVHPIGNWSKAQLGGRDFELVKTSSTIMKSYLIMLKKLEKELELNFEVSYEATHHGPYLTKPAIYIEIGSAMAQWENAKAAEAVAEAILNADYKMDCKTALGFGGLHYNPNFTRIALETDFAFSHMCPKYALPFLNKEMVEKAIAATIEKVDAFVVERKGLSTEKRRVLALLKEFGIQILRLEDVRKIKKSC